MADKPLEYAANLLKRGRDLAKQQTRILLLQGQMVRLRDEKERLFLRMGQKVYALFDKDLVKNADLLDLCRMARDLDQEIADREQEIEQLRAGEEESTIDKGDLLTEDPDTVSSASDPWSPPPSGRVDPGTAFLHGDAPMAEPGPPASDAETPITAAPPGADPTTEPEPPAESPAPHGEATPGVDPAAEPSPPTDEASGKPAAS